MSVKAYIPVRERPTWIYALAHPETGEIRYIGQTVKPLKTRLRVHVYHCASSKARVHRWIKGIGRPAIKALAIVEGRMANDTEKAVIARFRERGHRLVNHLEGGRSGYSTQLTAEQRARQDEARKRRVYVFTEEQRRQMSERSKGRRASPETKAKMSAIRKGRSLSPEHRAKIAAAHVGMKYSEETRARLRVAAAKRVANQRLKRQLERATPDA